MIPKLPYRFFIAYTVSMLLAVANVKAIEMKSCSQPPEVVAFWDFNRGDLLTDERKGVSWAKSWRSRSVEAIPDTPYRGVLFRYKAKEIDADATAEQRYFINSPLGHTFEYLQIYQPVNFYHRAALKLTTGFNIDKKSWLVGDLIESDTGATAQIAKIDDKFLFVENYSSRFKFDWGKGHIVTNKRSGAQIVSTKIATLPTNNKLSIQWQGKYSNSAIVVEAQSIAPAIGGVLGVSYCRVFPTKSKDHRSFGNLKNEINDGEPAICYDPKDNGKVIDFVIERKRSNQVDPADGIFRIWKKSPEQDWLLVFENTQVLNFQEENNVYDSGYVFGWSNSGFSEQTDFYLMQWGLWSEKPAFLPN